MLKIAELNTNILFNFLACVQPSRSPKKIGDPQIFLGEQDGCTQPIIF